MYGNHLNYIAISNVTSKPVQATQTVGTTPRIVNVMSVNPSARGGTSLISTRLPVPSKLGQAIASRISSASGGAKPNVIVVHKAQVWPQQHQQLLQGTTNVTKSGQTYKDIVTYSQKQQAILKSTGGISVIKPTLTGLLENRPVQTTPNTVIITSTTSIPSTASPSASILELDPSQLDEEKNTLLADLIQAAGISPEAAASAVASAVSAAIETFPPQMQTTTVTTTIASSTCPVSLVSSVSTTPCITEVPENMDTSELEDSTNTNLENESSSALLLGDLSSNVSARLSQEVIASTVASRNVFSSVPEQKKGKSLVTVSALVPKTTTSLPVETKSTVVSQKEKISKSSPNQSTMLSVQEIEMPLEQLHGGQVLEIQAPDTAALLNSDGQLSKEVLEILHQAGFQLQNEQVTIDTSGLELPGSTMDLHLDGSLGDSVRTTKEEEEEDVNNSTHLDPSTGLVYLPAVSEEQHKGDPKDETLPSIVSVFSTGVLPTSQLDLDNLHLVEDILVEKTDGSSHTSPTIESSLLQSSVQVEDSIEQADSVLEISGLHNELTNIENITSKSDSVTLESTDKSFVIPSMSIENIIEVGSTELVISGEEVQVGNTIMPDEVLVTHNEFGKNSPMSFM